MEIGVDKVMIGVAIGLAGLISKVGCDTYKEHVGIEVRLQNVEDQVIIQWGKIDELEEHVIRDEAVSDAGDPG